jgi:hypothetical protein
MPRDRLPVWLRVWGFLAWPGALYLVCRIVWEETLLTWREGPQMIGFSLMHTGPWLLLFLSVALALAWLLAVFVRSIVKRVRRQTIPTSRWVTLALGGALLALLVVPYGLWQRVGVRWIARGPNAPEFLTHAAATGDLAMVEALLRQGVDVNVRDSDGSTALHGAAVEGRTNIIAYLITQGADASIKNRFGHTALDNAREMHRDDAIRFLQDHGAK